MRKQACMMLGVSEFATDEQIKTAYKNLVKLYHPDSGNQQSSEHYTRIVQAYEYLKTHPAQAQQSYGRVLGTPPRTGGATFSYDNLRARAFFCLIYNSH